MQKVVIFYQNYAKEFSATLTPDSERALGPLSTCPFWGKYFKENHQQAQVLPREMPYERTKYSAHRFRRRIKHI